MLGVDEDTAIVGRRDGEWTVMGKSKAHVFTRDESRTYAAGEKFFLGK
jgi:cyanophycinase-like exopeptidase